MKILIPLIVPIVVLAAAWQHHLAEPSISTEDAAYVVVAHREGVQRYRSGGEEGGWAERQYYAVAVQRDPKYWFEVSLSCYKTPKGDVLLEYCR